MVQGYQDGDQGVEAGHCECAFACAKDALVQVFEEKTKTSWSVGKVGGSSVREIAIAELHRGGRVPALAEYRFLMASPLGPMSKTMGIARVTGRPSIQ